MRLTTARTGYSTNLSSIAFRYQPMKYAKYDIKAKSVSFKMFSDIMDIKVSDRIVEWTRQRVVAWVARFTDTLWQHMELVMRELWPTEVHETITRKTLDEIQSWYDPLLAERTEYEKTYIEKPISVLVDPIDLARDSIIQMLDAWKIEQVQYMMTAELTYNIKKEDRFVYNGLEYIVEWIIPQPYQILVGLNKSMVNYITKTE